jgi:1-acyl-sn-glycerol-3-phosphate acyltransferase
VLLAANHISWLDIIVLHSSCAMGFVGKAEIDSWPLFSYMARTGGTIFHQRGDHDSAAGVSSAMVERLKQGRAVTIFPEGGIKPGSTSVRVFHARLFRAAVEVGCPVQPVRIRYMRNGHRDDDIIFRDNENMMMNIGRMLARPGALAEIHFMPEIDASDQPRRALADAAREAVVKSYES